MAINTESMSELEKEIAAVEISALDEEQENAERNFEFLEQDLEKTKRDIPNPDVYPYSTEMYPGHGPILRIEKEENQPYWAKMDRIRKYLDNNSLYIGHVNINDTKDYYISQSIQKDNYRFPDNALLLDADDKDYQHIVRAWRFPDRNLDVAFSRNLDLKGRTVLDVNVIADRNQGNNSYISDAYLRKALLRNKSVPGMQGIIQTIQENQFNIRALPVDKNFIVQGCAGSGKTMVLLQRLRYLIYNEFLKSTDYIFFVPNDGFKEFIKDIANEFKINTKAIISVADYYMSVVNRKKKEPIEIADELIFAPEYLKSVYSREFICDAYQKLFDVLYKQSNNLIDFCSACLEDEAGIARETLKVERDKIRNSILTEGQALIKPVLQFIPIEITDIDKLEAFQSELSQKTKDAREEYQRVVHPDVDVQIDSNDPRLISNPKLNRLKNQIETEKKGLARALPFMRRAHERKLQVLNEDYNKAKKEAINLIKAEEEKIAKSKAVSLSFVYEGITIEESEIIVNKLSALLQEEKPKLVKIEEELEDFYPHFEEKYSSELELWNKFMELSTDINRKADEFVPKLIPAVEYFKEICKLGVELLEKFRQKLTVKEYDQVVMFHEMSEKKLESYFYKLLTNICRKTVFDLFGFKVCQFYKHFWYLLLYCQYLTTTYANDKVQYIFIDEGQDLSASEIELIYKINIGIQNPVMNIFGDTNQVISKHGIIDWQAIDFIKEEHFLAENFRNPNQVIDYCNKNLPFAMEKVGVDMDEVSEFHSIVYAMDKKDSSIYKEPIFIVKDEYARQDLKKELDRITFIKASQIITVKEAKGLEFKEVFVIDREMTDNERYIAYTRPLVKLNVIKTLEHYIEQGVIVPDQGEDFEEEIE